MKKILIGVFIVIILSFGIFGYNQITDDSDKIVDDNNHSITINS